MTQCRLCKSVDAVEDGAMCSPCQGEADEFWAKFGGGSNDGPARRSQILAIALGLAFASIAIVIAVMEILG